MHLPQSFQPEHREIPETFFDRQDADHEWGFGQCAGFLLAVHCAPEMPPASQWLPMALDDIEFQSEAETEQFIGALMALFNWIGERIKQHQLPIPPGYEPSPQVMDNFEPDKPIEHRGSGLMAGHVWSRYTPEHEEIMAEIIATRVSRTIRKNLEDAHALQPCRTD